MTSSNNKYNESEVQEETQTEEERYISECLSYMIDNYNRFNAGELQLALLPMENSGKTNVVGSVTEDDMVLLPYIKPWQKFGFNLVK